MGNINEHRTAEIVSLYHYLSIQLYWGPAFCFPLKFCDPNVMVFHRYTSCSVNDLWLNDYIRENVLGRASNVGDVG